MKPYDDPEYKGKVELTMAEATERKQCIGFVHYTLAESLMESKK